MPESLPLDLLQAETLLVNSIEKIYKTNSSDRILATLKFEGLKLMPIIFRLNNNLRNKKIKSCLLWSDAGGTALAQQQLPDQRMNIYSFSDALKSDSTCNNYDIAVAVSPQHYDYEIFEQLCETLQIKILAVNGRFEDSAVGIGSVGRERRKNFIASWQTGFHLEPITGGALMKAFPDPWMLFRSDTDGYRFVCSFDSRPNSEVIFETLNNQ